MLSDRASPNFPQLYEISILKLLHRDNPLDRKKSNELLAYAWRALAIAKKYNLETPLWAVQAMMTAATKSVLSSEPKGMSISAAQMRFAEKDVRIMKAVCAYEQDIRVPATLILAQATRPTTQDIERAYKDHIAALKSTLASMEQYEKKTADIRKMIASVKKAICKQTDEKGVVSKSIARKHNISRAILMKQYYKISTPKKKDAKKKPIFSLHGLFPAPFTE